MKLVVEGAADVRVTKTNIHANYPIRVHGSTATVQGGRGTTTTFTFGRGGMTQHVSYVGAGGIGIVNGVPVQRHVVHTGAGGARYHAQNVYGVFGQTASTIINHGVAGVVGGHMGPGSSVVVGGIGGQKVGGGAVTINGVAFPPSGNATAVGGGGGVGAGAARAGVEQPGSYDHPFTDALTAIDIRGAGTVAVPEHAGGALQITIAGSADVSLGKYVLDTLRINIAGSGDVDGRGVTAEAYIVVAGSGDVNHVVCVGRSSVTVAGSGDVRVVGRKNQIAQSVAGSGTVKITPPPARADA
jgi:hypothetical protein